jgi:hypothetical protein
MIGCVPCSVRVIDCSSLSSSSVRVRLRAAEPGRAILSYVEGQFSDGSFVGLRQLNCKEDASADAMRGCLTASKSDVGGGAIIAADCFRL